MVPFWVLLIRPRIIIGTPKRTRILTIPQVTLQLIQADLEKQEKLRGDPAGSDEEESEEEEAEKDFKKGAGGAWQDSLTYSEKVKLHLARALIMNPEVLVLQRPLILGCNQSWRISWKRK